eukprot:CAMPEP_0172174110 /NCGR_PEP_ID=MMETSP1050-20130122/13465_1 /TAXON_ID=233186 /ORGANISM="Cryptomonas curvata, Strain CCAP979/52" /LENGTH=130 /DNA_ID=CAMNT_0012846015 /DNA_START=352 /DNA_END=744 /DNA_ORIENTATION=+
MTRVTSGTSEVVLHRQPRELAGQRRPSAHKLFAVEQAVAVGVGSGERGLRVGAHHGRRGGPGVVHSTPSRVKLFEMCIVHVRTVAPGPHAEFELRCLTGVAVQENEDGVEELLEANATVLRFVGKGEAAV